MDKTKLKGFMKYKHSSLFILSVSKKETVSQIGHLGPYSQCLIFFVTSEWALKVRVLHNTRLKKLARWNILAY
jgi:hypothetical protein